MQLENDKLGEAKENAARLLEEAEKKRASVRFDRGLVDLEQGKFSVLENSEFVQQICPYLYEDYTRNDGKKSVVIFDTFFSVLIDGSIKNKRRISPILENIGMLGLNSTNIRLLQLFCLKYTEVLSNNYTEILLSSDLCQILSKSGTIFVRSNLWKDFENLVSILWSKKSTSFETVSGPVVPVQEILSNMATNDAIEKILRYHNDGDSSVRERAQKSIKYLGDKAIPFILNRLIYSVTEKERLLIMRLIGRLGGSSIKAIEKCLDKELPWYAVRNIIFIISDIGNPEYYRLVANYLDYPDIRVQQQVVACIVKLGGSDVEKRLLKALSVIHDEIKMKLVMQLGAYHGEELANGLVDLLHQYNSFPYDIKDELLFRICITLRSYPYPKVINLLKHLLKNRTYGPDKKEKITIAIQESINILEPKIRHLAKGQSGATDNLTFDYEAENEKSEDSGLDNFLEEISSILKRGEIEKASTLIYKKIIDSARSKNFQAAELLRDKLLDINPDALQDVIRAAEIIEEEKDLPVATHHVEIWEELYEKMSTDEFDTFYYSMGQEVYGVGETIVAIGEIDPCLYFVNSGVVRLSCKCGQKDTFLKRLKSGDVIGAGQFFSVSVWTVALTAEKSSQIHVLSRKKFDQIKDKFPEIEKKLYDFCIKKENIPALVKMSGNDRRDYARYPINVAVNNILLDAYGVSSGKRIFQGEMIDISRGGLAFSIRISNKDNANLLLGRQIISEINLRGNELLKCFGTVVGVRYQRVIVKEFAVYVKFYSEISQRQINDVLKLV